MALLVLPASAAVRRAVYDLRTLGVNAHGLDILHSERGGAYLIKTPKARQLSANDVNAAGEGANLDANPTLLVSTLASTRGLDLPELTHVFILGVPTDKSVDTYAHMAGRVGRFGRRGKVISVVEARDESGAAGKGKNAVTADEVGWLKHTFEQLDITPVRYEHFD